MSRMSDAWDSLSKVYNMNIPDEAKSIIGDVMLSLEQPERTGEWILVTDNNGQHFVCDECGEWKYHQKQNFCGNCGAEMREPE